MSDWLAVILLGIIEGVTEFLPVSSTGHLLLTEHLIGRTFSEVFNVVIQCGAVLAVLPVYAALVAALWGVFVWKEFKGAPEGTGRLLTLMFATFLVGLSLIVAARLA